MELKRRIDQVIKEGEAALSWDKDNGFTLSFKGDDFPEEVLAMLAFVDRFCKEDEFYEELLKYFDEQCSEEAE